LKYKYNSGDGDREGCDRWGNMWDERGEGGVKVKDINVIMDAEE
jgi:hypothetical protein